MKRPNRISILLIYFFLTGIKGMSQYEIIPNTAWILPGISYTDSTRINLTGQYGINAAQSMQALYLQSFIHVGGNAVYSPAYLYLHFYPAGRQVVREHGVMNALSLNFHINRFTVEDRNLLWNRIRQNADDLHYYRKRVKVSYRFTKGWLLGSLYLFDEGFVLLNDGRWARNRIALGFSANLRRWMNFDLTYILQQDKTAGNMSLAFLNCIVLFERKRQ